MAKQSLAERKADQRIERLYYQHCSGVQIDIMDIGKVFSVGRQAIAAGADDPTLAHTIVKYVEAIRKN